jgi:zinc protease
MPRRDSAVFSSYTSRMRSILANRDADPETPFWDTLQVTLAQYHPRERPLTGKTVDEVSLDRAVAFFRERFADASDFTFVFVGSFTLDSIKPLVLQYLGSLPALGRVERGRDLQIRPPAGVVQKTVRKGTEPKSRTQIIYTGPFEFARAERHALASLIDVLDIRLREVLREDQGGTYGVSISQATEREPWSNYSVHISFGSAPERLDSLANMVFGVIEQLQNQGPTAADLAKVKETQRRAYEKGLRENDFWLGQLLARSENAEDLRNVLTYPAVVDALTAERIRDTARKYLRKENYVRISLFPER